MFDLNSLHLDDTVTIELKNPETGDTLYCDEEKKDAFTWTVIANHTKAYKKLAAGMKERLKAEFPDKTIVNLLMEGNEKAESLLLDLTIESSMKFNMIEDGKKVKFSKDKARELLEKDSLTWLKKQVIEGATKTAGFMTSK